MPRSPGNDMYCELRNLVLLKSSPLFYYQQLPRTVLSDAPFLAKAQFFRIGFKTKVAPHL